MKQKSDMRSLSWDHGVVSINALGGMIGPTVFILPDGRPASPFHIAPWWNEDGRDALVGLIKGLRGEWPCVPFGFPFPAQDYPKRWPAQIEDVSVVTDVHGYGSGVNWTFLDDTIDEIALFVDYPEDHAVQSLERVIRPKPDEPTLEILLTIHMRRASCEPIGLHSCFRLPKNSRRAILEPGIFRIGRTHPSTIEPEAPIFAQDQKFTSLKSVTGRNENMYDASRLPFTENGEDILQLDDIDGTCSLAMMDEGYRVHINWEKEILPSLLLWYSNRGRSAAPWNNRHLCIGIEPICSSFGMSPDMSRAQNPIAEEGTSTCVPLSPNSPLTIRYEIGVSQMRGLL